MTLLGGERSAEAARAEVPRFEPEAQTSRYAAPQATISGERSKSWLRRAMPVVWSHKVSFIAALTTSFVGLVLQVQIPLVIYHGGTSIIAEVRHPHGNVLAPVMHDFWILVVLALASGAAAFVSRLYLMRTAYAMEFDLRNIIFEHLTRLSFGFYDRVQTGQLISRANSDIRSVQMYLTFAPAILVNCAIAFVAFGYMLSINVPLAFVAMVTTPLVYFVGVRMRNSLFPVSWLIQSRLADVATIVDENINGVRVVKSFAAEETQVDMLAKAAGRLRWAYVKDADLRARFTPAVQNLSQIGLALVLVVAGYLAVHDSLSYVVILPFSIYIVMLQAPFQMLGMLIMMGQRAKASAERIYEILDEQPTVVDRPGAVELGRCTGEVSFDAVDFSYRPEGPKILDGFSLHLAAGETVAMVGRTASGKSTVARLIPRFYDVTGGSVTIDGHDVRDVTLASLRSHIGLVLDEPFLFSATVRDNIAYGRPGADQADVEAAARAAGADAFIRALPLGYDTVVGERGYTLSGGQRQRVAIARTLLVNPPILVLDDATSSIDVQVELQIHDALRTLMQGRTTLIIAHRLSTISLADRVVLMGQGRVVADGTHAQLMATSPEYVAVLAQAEAEEALVAGQAEIDWTSTHHVPAGPGDGDGRRSAPPTGRPR